MKVTSDEFQQTSGGKNTMVLELKVLRQIKKKLAI